MKILLALIFCGIAFAGNACVSTAATSTASNLATTWTSCGGTTPQIADTATIISNVMFAADFHVQSITENNSSASLTTDGLHPYTITTDDNTTCIHVTLGMEYPTGYAIDTLSANFGNEVTFNCPGSGTSLGIIDQHGNASFRLWHCIFQGGTTSIPLGFTGDTGSVIDIQNSKFIGGVIGISIYFGSGAGGPLSLTINNVSSTGLGAGPFLHMYYSIPSSSCAISNVTIISPASNNPMFYSLDDISICLFTGNALETDAGGVYAPTFIQGGGTSPAHSMVLSYNLGKSHYPSQAGAGFGGNGTITHHALIQNNVLDGFSQNYAFSGNYIDLSGNICIARAAVGSEQGCYLGWPAQNSTSTKDIATAPLGGTGGNIGMFYLANGPNPSNTVVSRATVIGSLIDFGGGNILFGDGVPDMLCGGVDAPLIALSNSISYGGFDGVQNHSPACHYDTGGTGGIGVYNNNVFGAADINWAGGLTPGVSGGFAGFNFDNGATAHPSATYGDTQFDPKFVDPYRTWAKCDAIFGGPGTEANLFTQLFNRSNGTNPVNYTAQNIYACMRAGYAPREIRLADKGAVKPILIFTDIF